MLVERLGRGAAVGALAVSIGVAGLLPAATAAQQRAAAAGTGPAALRAAVQAVGGAADLRALRTFRYTARAQRSIHDEGLRPGGPAERSASVESTVRYALPVGQTPARVRVDAARTSLGATRQVVEVLARRRGFIRGVDANFSTAETKAMTSDRWAAILREQSLLNPHLLLRRALRSPELARSGDTTRVNGRTYRTLVLRNRVAPIRLLVDTRSGRLAMLRTMEHDYLRRDVPILVRYHDWTPAGGGLLFPRRVTLRSDGDVMLRETRGAAGLAVNRPMLGGLFRFPASVDDAQFDRRLARIGERTSQWLLSFANLGFIKDGGQTAINPIAITDGVSTADGVTLLGGVANNSLVVQRDGGVVVFEGALHDHRAEAVIRFIRRSPAFTGPITHVVTTHHHADHASGQRPYVALGATAVVGQPAVRFFRGVFAERDSTILPDRLDRSTAPATVQGVPAGGLALTDDQGQDIDVEVFRIPSDHAVDMVVPYVADQGVLFTSDIYSPPALPDPADQNAQAIAALVEAQNLDPQWIAGGHGTFIAYEDFAAALGGQ
ncbi:MAG: MBL fold metallo-hydrolase [Actinomycetota bacterium]|nr:MBL fold metallo-hydrolase [Actinomycetota bacterium]